VPLAAIVAVGLTVIGVLLAVESTRAIGVAVAAVVLSVIGFVASPTAFVLVYVGLRPLVDAVVFISVGPYTVGMAWGFGLLLVLVAYWIVRGFGRPMHGAGWVVPIGFALAYTLFALSRGGITIDAISDCVKIVSWVLLAVTCEQIAYTVEGQRLIMRAGTLMAILTLVVVGIAVLKNQYGAAFYGDLYGEGAFRSMGQGPHALASIAVITSTFVWTGAMHARVRWPYVLLASILGLAVALSFVRTTILGFGLLTLWFLAWSLRSRRPGAVAAAFAAALAVLGAVYVFREAMLERVADITLVFSGGPSIEAGSGRIGIWGAVLASALASPKNILLGQGANGSMQAVAMVFGENLWAHNDFLEFFITGGIGLALLHLLVLGWMILPAVRLVRDPRQSRPVHETGLLIAIVGLVYLVMAIFNGMAFYLSASLAMAMVVGLARGMCATPGATFLDAPAEADTASSSAVRDPAA
jgi:hypothetical protein